MRRFQDLTVIELAGDVAGAYAAKLFADLGARVLKVEPPGGDPSRQVGETILDKSPAGQVSAQFAALNTGKQSMILDLSVSPGRATLSRLLESADVVIESSTPAPLYPVTAGLGHSRLVRLYVSSFGLSGPYAGFRSTAFTDFAAGGQMYLTGEPDREPLQGAGSQPHFAAATYGFSGALVALLAREQTGRGQTVDVSRMETMASLHQWTTVRYTHGGFVQRRIGNRYDSTHPITIYPCKGGHVAISGSSDAQTERLLAVAGLSHLLEDPRFVNGVARLLNADAFDEQLKPWLTAHTSEEITTISQTVRVPVDGVPTLLELLRSPHLAARDFWHTVEGFPGLRFAGPPFRMSRHPWSLRRSPGLNEHEVTAVSVGRADEASGGPAVSGIAPLPSNAARPDAARRDAPGPAVLPLAGVRILDLSRVWAGPIAGRILGDFGADVIRVEAVGSRARQAPPWVVAQSRRYPNNEAGERPYNREGMFNKFNRNKRAITLQLNTPQGKSVFERLVQVSDVVLENYSPRVMPQFGLGYDRLSALNPAVIYIGMPGYGWNGPSRDYVAFGTTLEPAAGLSQLMGYRDGGPYKSGVAWADPVAGLNAAAAVMTALYDRSADPEGRGQAIELAQLEGMIAFIGDELLAAQVRGSDPPRPGNRHPVYAPQGCYSCAGDDRWIAITITSDQEWRALCSEAGWGADLAAMPLEQRRREQDRLDAMIAAWTMTHEHQALMHRLQRAGVVAFALLDAKELVEDPHLAARGFFPQITHPDAGTYPFPGQPAHLSETPATFRRPAPGYGEHNREVLSDLLGLNSVEMAALYDAGVIADEPPL